MIRNTTTEADRIPSETTIPTRQPYLNEKLSILQEKIQHLYSAAIQPEVNASIHQSLDYDLVSRTIAHLECISSKIALEELVRKHQYPGQSIEFSGIFPLSHMRMYSIESGGIIDEFPSEVIRNSDVKLVFFNDNRNVWIQKFHFHGSIQLDNCLEALLIFKTVLYDLYIKKKTLQQFHFLRIYCHKSRANTYSYLCSNHEIEQSENDQKAYDLLNNEKNLVSSLEMLTAHFLKESFSNLEHPRKNEIRRFFDFINQSGYSYAITLPEGTIQDLFILINEAIEAIVEIAK